MPYPTSNNHAGGQAVKLNAKGKASTERHRYAARLHRIAQEARNRAG